MGPCGQMPLNLECMSAGEQKKGWDGPARIITASPIPSPSLLLSMEHPDLSHTCPWPIPNTDLQMPGDLGRPLMHSCYSPLFQQTINQIYDGLSLAYCTVAVQ